MKFTMIKGNATALHEQDIYTAVTDQDFFSQTYISGLNAISKYVQQAKPYRKISGSNLYRSPLNIVAFSGGRGTGKTSTLLAVAKLLKDQNQVNNVINEIQKTASYPNMDVLKNHQFTILDPLDPTMLEDNQNILTVILSRIMYEAEQRWENAPAPKPVEAKNKILAKLNDCLNGINSIKSNSSSSKINNLDQLQKIGDSSALKQNFFDLVNQLNQFCKVETSSDTNTLVIMIDDTDCQISKAYEVMEDIRKYLTLPNILILMATDTKQLRLVLIQHFLEEFSKNLNHKFITEEEIKHMADQYMTKLLPNINKIYLPTADEVFVDNFSQLHIRYIEEPDTTNNRLKEFDKDRNLILAQSQLLNYLYQKTHLVFLTHSKYINHILPSTLRELAILLNLLSDMPDVPEIIYMENAPADKDSILYYSSTNELKEKIIKQLDILEANLDLFESYFMNEWIPSNLSYEMIGIIRGIASQAPEECCGYAYKEFLKYYETRGFSTKGSAAFAYIKEKITFKNLDMLLKLLNNTVRTDGGNIGNFRSQQDFNNIFAVRVLFTIKNMKYACGRKRCTINEHKSDKLIFDYYKDRNALPDQLYLNQKEDDSYVTQKRRHLNLTEDIFACLIKKTFNDKKLSQSEIYQKQEAALLIAVNCDLMEFVSKELFLTVGKVEPSYFDAVEKGFTTLQEKISYLNNYMLDEYKENADPFSYCETMKYIDMFTIIDPEIEKLKDLYNSSDLPESLQKAHSFYGVKSKIEQECKEQIEILRKIDSLDPATKGKCTRFLNSMDPSHQNYKEAFFSASNYSGNDTTIEKQYRNLLNIMESIIKDYDPSFKGKLKK